MPKLYEYFGLVIFFYANEHEPIHVHGAFGNCEARAEIVLREGRIVKIIFDNAVGRRPLSTGKMKDFKKVVKFKADEIVSRWVDFFVKKKHVNPEVITKKLS
jgi:hypothetical protein